MRITEVRRAGLDETKTIGYSINTLKYISKKVSQDIQEKTMLLEASASIKRALSYPGILYMKFFDLKEREIVEFIVGVLMC